MKQSFRNHYKTLRASIPAERRFTASQQALDYLKERLKSCKRVLSYVSFRDEFDTAEINSWLASEGKLVLPRVEGEHLELFEISQPEMDLERGKWGIFEPKMACRHIDDVAFALAPGLAFDRDRQRLGYGRGYYDRLLTKLSGVACGLGFQEQFSATRLPAFPTDIFLDELLLF